MSDDAQNLELMASIFQMDPRNKQTILRAAARIREQRDLLEECEKALEAFAMYYSVGINPELDDAYRVAIDLIARLGREPSAQENADK